MNAGRVLATSTSYNVVSEVTRDTVMRTRNMLELFELGRIVGTERRNGSTEMLGAVVRACSDEQEHLAGALALAGGVFVATQNKQAQRVCNDLVRRQNGSGGSSMLRVWTELAPFMKLPNINAVVAEAERMCDVSVLGKLASYVNKQSVDRVACAVHAAAVDVLLRMEMGVSSLEDAHSVVHAAASVAQHLVDGTDRGLDRVWTLVADTLACTHWASVCTSTDFVQTVDVGRAGTEDYRRACTALVSYAQRQSNERTDAMVHSVFALQPCLRFLPRSSVRVGRGREGAVLFYMDLLEHVTGQLTARTVNALVMPMAARYVERVVDRDWFESAHALVLSVLDAGHAEVAPWYARVVLALYPQSINMDLLGISFTAAVRALAHNGSSGLARNCVDLLIARIDEYAGNGVERGERRRELLCVLASQVASVPLELLSFVMTSIDERVDAEPLWATRRNVVSHVQDTVLESAELARRPALASWVWRMRARVDARL
ncbi:hypothetical protein IW147_002705 [Coemansia sp. RSA 720]|nr:hypothetical protein IW147_002705 [Coemansia sp. RSA 720]